MTDVSATANKAPGFVQKPDHRVDLAPARGQRVRVMFAGIAVADSVEAIAVSETGHGPVYYIPRKDARMDLMSRTPHHTYCPYKGDCSYWTLAGNGKTAENAVWSYETPYDEVTDIKERLAFYPDRVDSIVAD